MQLSLYLPAVVAAAASICPTPCPALSLAILSAIVDAFFIPFPSISDDSLSTVSVLFVLLDVLSTLLVFGSCALLVALIDPTVVTMGVFELLRLAMRSRTDIV